METNEKLSEIVKEIERVKNFWLFGSPKDELTGMTQEQKDLANRLQPAKILEAVVDLIRSHDGK